VLKSVQQLVGNQRSLATANITKGGMIMKEFVIHLKGQNKKTKLYADSLEEAFFIHMLDPQVDIDPGLPYFDKSPIVKSSSYRDISQKNKGTCPVGWLLSEEEKKKRVKWRKLCAKVIKRDKGKCRRCDATETLSVHHIKPRDKGGKDHMHNLLTLCEPCHDWVELNQPQRIRRIKV
jgi:hypothetical protein